MKIISQYKDYYDYLTGIYGVDEKVVLDRRQFDKYEPPTYSINKELGVIVQLFICDTLYTGYYHLETKQFYWGLDVLKICSPSEQIRYENSKDKNIIHLPTHADKILRWGSSENFNPFPFESKIAYNTLKQCPIMIAKYLNWNDPQFYMYPKLSELGVSKILPPMDIYLKLTAWLAPRENYTDNRTNNERVVSAGFDLKHSFRNTK